MPPKFVPRVRKHKVLARQKSHSGAADNGDAASVATEILPEEQRARAQKKDELKKVLVKESVGKISGKKKKRMDKYIDTKLQKEENLVILKKLAAQKVDTSLYQSSRRLGTAEETKKEKMRRANMERRAGIDVEKNEAILFEERREAGEMMIERHEDEDEESDAENAAAQEPEYVSRKRDREALVGFSEDRMDTTEETPAIEPVTFGGGLKRPLELDESGRPIIQARKRQKKAKAKKVVVQAEPEWEGFSSEEEEGEAKADEDGRGLSDEDDSDIEEDYSDSSENSALDFVESEESESESDDESDSSVDPDRKERVKQRSSAFKAWATVQKNEAAGFTPSTNIAASMPPKPANFEPRAPEMDPLPPELESNTATDATRKAYSVVVTRTPEIQEARMQLPVVAEEQKIMEAIHNHHVVVVWGATGSGKTTQVPQFLYEAGYGAPGGPTPGMIGVTQPRRVAAVSMSKRVGDELGDAGDKVAHQIRFDTTTNAKTAIKFMTDGVLLREISQDFSLTKYSVVIIDEAHERSVNTDILVGMLSRIVDLRAKMGNPLKLVIMSATLRISDFTENKRLFRGDPPPLLKAEGRQYTVTNHFARRTQRDYVEEMFNKVSKGHKKLPRGGILIFLTGQNEITQLAKRLKQAFASTQGEEAKFGKVQVSPAEAPIETEDIELGGENDDYLDNDGSDSEDDELKGLDDDEEHEEDKEFDIGEEEAEETVMKVHVLPLYSQLPTNQQMRVFDEVPEGSRLIVIATNVAETSLTIPGIRYVFDCGRAKEKKYDLVTGVQSFEVGWISKASANQRAGRAGRTGPGHCYRLYSSAVFERDFEEYSAPEILRTPLEGVVLQLKSMGAPVVGFPFPTSPDRESLQKAEHLLSYLGALSPDGKVTKLGHELSLYPLNPRFSRMLVMGIAQNMTAETIALVAALAVPELIIPENKLGLRDPPPPGPDDVRTEQDNIESEARTLLRRAYNAAQAKLALNAKQSDCIKFHSAVCAYAHESHPQDFCDDMFLNSKSMNEAAQLRKQLTNIVRTNRPSAIGPYSATLPAPSEKSINLLMQICAAGFIDNVAMRADLSPTPPELARKPRSAIDVPYVTLFPSSDNGARRAHDADPADQFVFLHPSSVLARTPIKNMPGFVIYSHLQRAGARTIEGSRIPKTRMHPLTPVTRPQLVNIALGTPLLAVSKPKGKIVDLERDAEGRERRECEVELTLVGERGSQGWGLGVRRCVMRKEGGSLGWVVERVL